MSQTGRRTAVVTGAGSGIGLALGRQLSVQGFGVVLVDRDAEAVVRAADGLGGTAVVMDVADPAEHVRLLEMTGPPAVLCLNAGVVSSIQGPVWEAPAEEWRRVFDINLGGIVNGLRVFVPAMLEAGDAHRLMITASLAGLATWPGGGALRGVEARRRRGRRADGARARRASNLGHVAVSGTRPHRLVRCR